MLTMASLVNRGPGPNLVNEDFLLPAWRTSMKTIKSTPLSTTNRELVSVERTVLLFIRIGELHVYTWFEVIENTAVDVLLGMSFINRCISGRLPSE